MSQSSVVIPTPPTSCLTECCALVKRSQTALGSKVGIVNGTPWKRTFFTFWTQSAHLNDVSTFPHHQPCRRLCCTVEIGVKFNLQIFLGRQSKIFGLMSSFQFTGKASSLFSLFLHFNFNLDLGGDSNFLQHCGSLTMDMNRF